MRTTAAIAMTLSVCPFLSPSLLLAQATPEPEAKARSVLDDSPLLSARAAGMAGAIAPLADDLDAAFHNPAGIGGQGWGKKAPPFVRKLYFPWFGAAANQSARALISEARGAGASSDSMVGKAVVDAHAGKRQYARASTTPALVLGRSLLVPFADMQVAATSKGDGTANIDTRYRSTSGLGLGTSITDSEGRFALGYFAYTASRSETAGSFLYDDMIDADSRKRLLSANSTRYSARGQNAGLTWRMAKTAAPTLAVAVKDIGDTTYDTSKAGADDVVVKQDLTLGFSLTGALGKSLVANFVLEGGRLEHEDLTVGEKLRAGAELLYSGVGATGSYATLGLRTGWNAAGPAGGLSLNLGLVGLEAAVQSVDIGAGNEKVIERRGIVTLFVNVAEF